MKTFVLQVLIITSLLLPVNGQTLADYYKSGTVKLEAVPGYGIKNNWNELFSDYSKKSGITPIGAIKQIVVAPDGSVFMSHKTRHEIWKFDPEGNFEKKFGQHGGKKGQFIMIPRVQGIFDGKYIFTMDVGGRMLFFDLDGNYIKTMTLDYMGSAKSLDNGKLAVLGNVLWKTKWRVILVSKDFETGKEKIIWDMFRERLSTAYMIKIPNFGMISIGSPLYISRSKVGFFVSPRGNIILANPRDGKVTRFAPDGQELSSFQLNITPVKITDQDINEYYESSKKRFEEIFNRVGEKLTEEEKTNVRAQINKVLGLLKNPALYPQYMPYFSKILYDSDGNILVFEFTKDKDKSDQFKVFSFDVEGHYIGTAVFQAPGYELNLSSSTFVFHKGFIYAVCKKTDDGDIPLRLVKFRLIPPE
ncbi:MAG: hypothetical protein GXO83_02780 [Chlorobi bacterium]|nr:hypothetical protein [Chlorobiota bacterium]